MTQRKNVCFSFSKTEEPSRCSRSGSIFEGCLFRFQQIARRFSICSSAAACSGIILSRRSSTKKIFSVLPDTPLPTLRQNSLSPLPGTLPPPLLFPSAAFSYHDAARQFSVQQASTAARASMPVPSVTLTQNMSLTPALRRKRRARSTFASGRSIFVITPMTRRLNMEAKPGGI